MDNASELTAEIIAIITRKADTGAYIFRGENEYREEPIKSSLLREYEKPENRQILNLFTLAEIEANQIAVARHHAPSHHDAETILFNLQHHRGKTTLIDFSEDFLIALFFACDGNFDADARFIFLNRDEHAANIIKPTEPANRVTAQKSVFVKPADGAIPMEQFEQIKIPKAAKPAILRTLRNSHAISGPYIYNDLHGFVTRNEVTSQALRNVERAIALQKAGYYQAALDNYAVAIDRQPENAIPFTWRAMVHFHLGNFESAIADNTRAITLDPTAKNAYSNRGTAHHQLGNRQQALADYKQALDIDPGYASAYNNRGALHHSEGNYRSAIDDYTKAIDTDPELAVAYCNRGKVNATGHHTTDGTAFALPDFDKAIALDPALAEAYYHRAMLLKQQPDAVNTTRYDIAQDLETAYRLDPKLRDRATLTGPDQSPET